MAHLVDLNGLYKNQVSEVESDVGNHTEFSQQICLFLRSVLLPFWKFFDILKIAYLRSYAQIEAGNKVIFDIQKMTKIH